MEFFKYQIYLKTQKNNNIRLDNKYKYSFKN